MNTLTLPKSEKSIAKSKNLMWHLEKANGDAACGSNTSWVRVSKKSLVDFIARYNNPETRNFCCDKCRDSLKIAQINYKAKNNGSLKGFKF